MSPVGLGLSLICMLGSDTPIEGDTTSPICGVASCLVLDILKVLINKKNVGDEGGGVGGVGLELRHYFGTRTQIVPMLMGALQMLAEKNEHIDHQIRFDPIEELGSFNYFAIPEIDPSPKLSQYPKPKYYRPKDGKFGCEEDEHNLLIAEEWSVLRCHRSQPLVLERCAVLLWSFAEVINICLIYIYI
jgi:hypothetical protein